MNTIHNIQNIILKEIKDGSLNQKPKWHFLVLSLFIIFSIITLSLLLLYLVSFVTLFLREHFIFDALSFGPRTVFEIMYTLPLLLIVLVITVFLLLHVLVRHFAFAYIRSVSLTFGMGILIVLTLFGIILLADKNSNIARMGEGKNLHGVEKFNRHLKDRVPPLPIQGIIIGVDDNTVTIVSGTSSIYVVTITERTRKDKSSYTVNDSVMLLAIRKEDGLHAMAIRINDGSQPPMRNSRGR